MNFLFLAQKNVFGKKKRHRLHSAIKVHIDNDVDEHFNRSVSLRCSRLDCVQVATHVHWM